MWATENLGFSQAATVPVFCVNKNYHHAKIPGRNIVKKEIYLGQGRRFVRLQTSSFLSLNPLPPRCRAGGRVRSALFLWVSVCKYSHQSWFQAGNVELRDDACSPLPQPGKESFLCMREITLFILHAKEENLPKHYHTSVWEILSLLGEGPRTRIN